MHVFMSSTVIWRSCCLLSSASPSTTDATAAAPVVGAGLRSQSALSSDRFDALLIAVLLVTIAFALTFLYS